MKSDTLHVLSVRTWYFTLILFKFSFVDFVVHMDKFGLISLLKPAKACFDRFLLIGPRTTSRVARCLTENMASVCLSYGKFLAKNF